MSRTEHSIGVWFLLVCFRSIEKNVPCISGGKLSPSTWFPPPPKEPLFVSVLFLEYSAEPGLSHWRNACGSLKKVCNGNTKNWLGNQWKPVPTSPVPSHCPFNARLAGSPASLARPPPLHPPSTPLLRMGFNVSLRVGPQNWRTSSPVHARPMLMHLQTSLQLWGLPPLPKRS